MTKIGIILAVLSGVISGLGAAFLGAHATAHESPQPQEMGHGVAQQHDSSDWVQVRQRQQLLEMEKELHALRMAAQSNVDPEETTQANERAKEEAARLELELDPELGRKRAFEHWQGRLRQYEEEPEDRQWANPMIKTVATQLSAMAGSESFELVQTRCKTTTCSAQLLFRNYEVARQNFFALLQNHHQACGIEVSLPPPAAGREDSPYEVTVLYDCKLARTIAVSDSTDELIR